MFDSLGDFLVLVENLAFIIFSFSNQGNQPMKTSPFFVAFCEFSSKANPVLLHIGKASVKTTIIKNVQLHLLK